MNLQATIDMEMLPLRHVFSANSDQGSDPRQLLCEILHKDPSESVDFGGIEPDRLWNILYQPSSETEPASHPRGNLNIDDEDESYSNIESEHARQNNYHINWTSNIYRQETLPICDLNTVYGLIAKSRKIVVLMGAGASSGPDFRSPGGLYDSIAQSGALEDPYDVFDVDVYSERPEIFWQFAHLIFPSERPVYSSTHLFVEQLEQRQKLLRVYSQNVDTLERGIPDHKLVCVHGSWRENKCCSCGHVYGIEDLRPAVNARTVPRCVVCGGLIKPGIVFFGQPTNLDDDQAYSDAREADLLIVIGTSLKVAPISELPSVMRNVPSIFINREPVSHTFNAELIGECDDIIKSIELALGWDADAALSIFDEDDDEGNMDDGVQVPTFYEPNKFIFHSNSSYATSIIETARSRFLVTPRRMSPSDFD